MLESWQKNPSLRLVMQAAIIFFSVALLLTLHRYYSFYASYDQGIFNQVYWNGLQGHFFESSLSSALSTNVVHHGEVPDVSYHRLGQHFTPALLVWLPLYALFPSPVTLTVLQVTLVTAAGFVLYALGRHHLEPPLSALITISFYGAQAVVSPTLGNFHDICQIPLYIFGLLLAMERRCWWLFWLLAILTLAVREDAGVTLFGVGVYLILSKRYPRTGLAVCTLSFGYMLVLTNLIMPLFSEDISQRFMIERFGQYAEEDEASTLDILWGIVSNPLRLIAELLNPPWGTFKYLIGQWLPLAFVPAVAPAAWMIAGFPLLKLFLAKGESVLSITIRYAMTVVPGLFYGSIIWWARQSQGVGTGNPELKEAGDQEPSHVSSSMVPLGQELHPTLPNLQFRRFWVLCLCLSLLFSITSNPNRTLYFLIPDSVHPWVYISLPRQWQHVRALQPLLAQIPSDSSVAATTYIIPQLSGRREILRFPQLELRNDAGQIVTMEYIIADLWQMQQYQVAFKSERGRLKQIVPLINQLLADKKYGILGFQDGVILMKQGANSEASAVAAYGSFRQEIQPILQQDS